MTKKIVLTTITCLWMIIIFLFSNQEAETSSKVSNSFIDKTVIKIYKAFDEDLTKEKEFSIKDKLITPIRKSAHLFVYLILGILMFLTLNEYNVKKNIVCYAIILCFVYAITDEFHQLFVNGRSGEFKDILIDTLGSTIGVFGINFIKINKRKNK